MTRSTTATGRRKRLDPDDRREDILAAARRLFADQPYEAVSATDLAREAGTTRTNLNYYFGTKRDLYLAVVSEFGEIAALPSEWVVAGAGQAGIDSLFARWLDELEQHPHTILTLVRAQSPGVDADISAVFERGSDAWARRLITVLGVENSEQVCAAIRAFQGLTSVALVEWLHKGTLTREQVQRMLTAALMTTVDAVKALS